MIELDLLGPDGDRIVMTDAQGERYSIVVDDALRTAVRRARPAALTPVPQPPAPGAMVRPRDLQAMMRAGASAQEVAQATGLDVEHIRRFEGPVLAERSWAVSQAKACHIGWEKDSPILGELVIDRLATRGVEPDTLSWDAMREGREPWQVVLTFIQGAQEKQARWELDSTAHTVAALDDEARWLTEATGARIEVFDQDSRASGSRHLTDSRTLPAFPDDLQEFTVNSPLTPPAGISALAAAAHAPLEPPILRRDDYEATEALLEDLARSRGQRTPTPVLDAEDEELAGEIEPTSGDTTSDINTSHSTDADTDADEEMPNTASSGLPSAQVVSMSERRRQLTGNHPAGSKLATTHTPSVSPAQATAPSAASSVTALTPATGTTAVVAQSAGDSAQEALPDMPDAPAPKRPRRTRRSVPSWDEIVFGAKPE